MDSGILIASAGCSTAQSNANASTEACQPQQNTLCGGFSALLQDAVKNTDDQPAPSRSDAGSPIEPTSDIAVGASATGASLIEIVMAALYQVPATPEAVVPVDDKSESVPATNVSGTTNSASIQTSTPTLIPTPISSATPTVPTIQSVESLPVLTQGLTMAIASDDGTVAHEPGAANPSPSKATDSSSVSLPQPVLARDQAREALATQPDVPTTNKHAIRNDRVTPSHLAPVLLEQPSDVPALSGTRPPSSLMPDQGATPIMVNQGNTNLLPVAQGQGNALVPPLARPSADIRPSALVQEQGDQKAALLSQSLSVRVSEASGGEQASFGDAAQGEGEASFFQFNASGVPESVVRGNQSPLFSDQLMSARQAPPSPQGTGSLVGASTTDHMKLAQGFTDGNHSATMTSMSGMAQTVHLELPSHGSGPINVRISMTDQTVHTQFTTDRSDLGALLLTRQDQLQQTLTKSGFELGQFQVHVNQEGRQDTLPDRQSRRNDATPEQQLPSRDHNAQTQDQERPNHRPMRTLSLFA